MERINILFYSIHSENKRVTSLELNLSSRNYKQVPASGLKYSADFYNISILFIFYLDKQTKERRRICQAT